MDHSTENEAMELSSEDEDTLMLTLLCKDKENKKRKYWVHPINDLHGEYGTFFVMKKILRKYPEKFRQFHRMEIETFPRLLSSIGSHLTKKDTNCRLAICPEERLQITLRFLGTQASFRDLSFGYLRGESTVAEIVVETCDVIWNTLSSQYMPFPTEDMWVATAKRYQEKWQMPNCIGALDGKHIRIRKPANTGSTYYNYLGHFSIVLMAVSDADGMFSVVNVGDYGRNSDGGVLRHSPLGSLLSINSLNVPAPVPLPDETDPFPFYFVGDEAFPLTENIMRPYPVRDLNNDKRIFNGRLSRARKTTECAFERVSSKFRVLYSRMGCEPHKIETIVKATCILHNFVYSYENFRDNPNENCTLPFGKPLQRSENRRGTNSAIYNRDRLRSFFIKPCNAVPWQKSFCVKMRV